MRLGEGEVVLAFPRDAGFHKTTVTGSTAKPAIEKALAEHFGHPVRLSIDDSPDAASRAQVSVAEQEREGRAAYEKSTGAKVRSHPAVRAVLASLGGEIEHIQVLERAQAPAPDSEPEPEEGG